jgi:hypothetical protein
MAAEEQCVEMASDMEVPTKLKCATELFYVERNCTPFHQSTLSEPQRRTNSECDQTEDVGGGNNDMRDRPCTVVSSRNQGCLDQFIL